MEFQTTEIYDEMVIEERCFKHLTVSAIHDGYQPFDHCKIEMSTHLRGEFADDDVDDEIEISILLDRKQIEHLMLCLGDVLSEGT